MCSKWKTEENIIGTHLFENHYMLYLYDLIYMQDHYGIHKVWNPYYDTSNGTEKIYQDSTRIKKSEL